MADSTRPVPFREEPSRDRAPRLVDLPVPVLGSCGCGSGCSCGCQSGGACQCGGSCG
ncbi:hypothetical protein [Streptomyces sp. 8N706]|uniref:hypothetical protein n=1 Tax=Streptomyces sp. 8N706 TaxID=3457416 RepID=UPI003FD0A93F